MKKEVFKINGSGFILERYVAEFDNYDNPVDELAENIITTSPPSGLYRAKWTGVEWIEDMSQTDINVLNSVVPILTTEQKVNNLLTTYQDLKTRMDFTEEAIIGLIIL